MKNEKDLIPTAAFLIVAVAGIISGALLSDGDISGIFIIVLVIVGLMYGILFRVTITLIGKAYDSYNRWRNGN